jgi:hypothetical protein
VTAYSGAFPPRAQKTQKGCELAPAVVPDVLELRLQQRLDALPPAARAELLHVPMLPNFDRAERIGEFWSYPSSRSFAELLIDAEEDRASGPCWSGCCARLSGRSPRSRKLIRLAIRSNP